MRNECDGQESIGKPLSSSHVFRADAKELEQAHLLCVGKYNRS